MYHKIDDEKIYDAEKEGEGVDGRGKRRVERDRLQCATTIMADGRWTEVGVGG